MDTGLFCGVITEAGAAAINQDAFNAILPPDKGRTNTNTFKVGITRTVCCCHEFVVEADSEDVAIELATQQAYDTTWTGGNVDYELDYLEEEE